MLTKRIIACLDVDAGRVVKGVHFDHLRDAGDPADLARGHSASGADEIVLLDICATQEHRATLLDVVRATAREIFIPFAVGGGIRSLDDAIAVIDSGADKVAINSAALQDPGLISCIAQRFGSQAVVLAVDAKLSAETGGYEVWASGGKSPTGREVAAWVREGEQRGAGEILLTSIDRDGTGVGFDCVLTALVASTVRIPVIASGGAGGVHHFVEVFQAGKADAALAASIFHFGLHDVADLKHELVLAGLPVRWPC